MLGDNIFTGPASSSFGALRSARRGLCICLLRSDPQRYGVIEFDSEGRAIGIRRSPPNRAHITP